MLAGLLFFVEYRRKTLGAAPGSLGAAPPATSIWPAAVFCLHADVRGFAGLSVAAFCEGQACTAQKVRASRCYQISEAAAAEQPIQLRCGRATPGALNVCASLKAVEVRPGGFLSGRAGQHSQ